MRCLLRVVYCVCVCVCVSFSVGWLLFLVHSLVCVYVFRLLYIVWVARDAYFVNWVCGCVCGVCVGCCVLLAGCCTWCVCCVLSVMC